MKLLAETFEKSAKYIDRYARPLDKKLFDYYFFKGSVEAVTKELEKFQNKDGGFGHSLEPDFQLDISSPMATTVGLQYATKLKLTSDHPIVEKAVNYLLKTFDEDKKQWQSVPEAVNKVARAPWWNFDANNDPPFANPSAEIVGYLSKYSIHVSSSFLEMVTIRAMEELKKQPIEMEIHDFYCYQRLLGMVDSPLKEIIYNKLEPSVRAITQLSPEKWGGYGAKPIEIASSPQSLFFHLLEEEIQLNLTHEIYSISEEGCWSPNWSWFGQYDEEWEQAEQDWKGYLTVNTLKILSDFGKIEKVNI